MVEQLGHLNHAINYIEMHLTQPLTMAQVAASVGYSRFHFDRLFLTVVGDTPASYLRKRRLTEAAREIVYSDKRLLDIALDYQFQSQEAFIRAFQRMFGCSPGTYRRRRRLTRPFFKITVRPQRLFSLWVNGQTPQLLLPSQKLTTRCLAYPCLLVARPATLPLFRQERAHVHPLTPTKFCFALEWPSHFRHR